MNLIGLETEVQEATIALQRREAVILYGPTGNGKTLAAWKIANDLTKGTDMPVIYLQLYPEMTKNTLIGGETLKNGSIVIEEQSIIKFGTEGAIFIIDECTHTTEPVLLAFNSLIEEPYSTVIGNKIYKISDRTRFIFCGNYPDHVGNIHLPTSFQNRLYIISVPLPSKEILVKIGKAACPETPTSILEFVADIITQAHEPSFPISGRNMAMAARAIPAIFQSGWKANEPVDRLVSGCCQDKNINTSKLKQVLMSTLMGNAVSKSQGPDKVAALLW